MRFNKRYWIAGFIIIVAFFLFYFMGTVMAEKTVKTIQIPFIIGQNLEDNSISKIITLNPPDRVSEILSAEIVVIVDVQSQNGELSVKINGNNCNPALWTSPKNEKRYTAYFDCSERITNAGNYNVTFNVEKKVENIYAYYRITYYNRPKGFMDLMGTEYTINDMATIFLQLKDEQGISVNDGTCYIDIYYPNYANQSHPIMISNAPMLYKNGSDGLYFYDLIVPNITGVYMLSATCSYTYNRLWFYESDDVVNSPNRTVLKGTYIGDTQTLNSYSDWVYTECTSATGSTKYCEAYYDFNVSLMGNQTISNIDLYYSGESNKNNNLKFYVWNWSSSNWILLDNELDFHGTATVSAQNLPSGINEFSTNNVPNDTVSTDYIVRIKLVGSHNKQFKQYDNWLALSFLTVNGTIQNLKGSGEMHIRSNITNITVSAIAVVDYDKLSKYIWNFTNRNLTFYNLTASDIWNFPQRNLTYYEIATLDYELIADYVWNESQRNLTYYEDVTDYLLIQAWLWNASNRTLTYYPPANVSIDYELISDYVWNRSDRNLTYYEDIVNYLKISQFVWNFSNRTVNLTEILNEISESNISIHNKLYEIINLIDSLNNLSATEVWNFANRNLTFYPACNYTEIADNVWNYTNRNLTFYMDTVDYLKIQEMVWNRTHRNLTYYPAISNITIDYELIADYVWNESQRNLTYYQDVTNYLYLQGLIWNYTNRTLTDYNLSGIISIINNLPPEIWNFAERNLTFYPPTINYSIINATLNATIWQPEEVWEVFFRRGTPPLMPSTEYYCSDNYTLIKEITFEWCEKDGSPISKCKNYSKVEDIYCQFGCDNGTGVTEASCNPSPMYRNAILIILVIMIIGFFFFGKRYIFT